MGSISSSIRVFAARASAAALAVPILLGGAITASVAVVSHPMLPAVGSGAAFDLIGDAQVSGQVKISCQKTVPPVCYGPDQIRAAYDIQSVLDSGVNGIGRSIAIIDAIQSPTIRQDLALFDHVWGYPDATLNIVAPDGLTPYDVTNPTHRTWSGEISLDVEWAHVIAPRATINLVLAKSGDDADLLSATRYAVRHNLGDVISQSFGEAEQCMDRKLLAKEHALFAMATERGMTLVSASGDFGATQLTCDGNGLLSARAAATPASDPLVTGVGGTHLNADGSTGAYQSEIAWPGSGGGFSAVYKRPAYQAGLRPENMMRGLPDVAYTGDRMGGVPIVWGSSPFGPGRLFLASGTSVGTPQWAGILVLATQAKGHRLGAINKALYRLAAGDAYAATFHDIRVGSNTFGGVTGFPAGPGWDAVTGLGTPDVAHLLRRLGDGESEGQQTGGE